MDKVIRLTFDGRTLKPKLESPSSDDWCQLHPYGQAAGYLVGLLREETGLEGQTHRVVVGRTDSNTIETVAVVTAYRKAKSMPSASAWQSCGRLKSSREAKTLRPEPSVAWGLHHRDAKASGCRLSVRRGDPPHIFCAQGPRA